MKEGTPTECVVLASHLIPLGILQIQTLRRAQDKVLVRAFRATRLHLILPEDEGGLLVYGCLVFDGSNYRPETADVSSTGFEFYMITCRLPADELIGY